MTDHANDSFLETLSQIAPYLNAHRGKTFVLHVDAALWEVSAFKKLCQDISLLQTWNVNLVVVPGNTLADQPLSPDALSVALAEGYQRLEQLQSALSSGALDRPSNAQRLRVVQGNVVRAVGSGVISGVDYQKLGRPVSVDSEQIRHWHQNQSIVTILPKGYAITGEVYALASQSFAAWLAQSLSAEKLIYLSADSTLQALIKPEGYHWMTIAALRDQPESVFLTDTPASQSFREILLQHQAETLKRIHLIPGVPGALIRELYTPRGAGYMIAADSYDQLRPAQMRDVPGISALIEPLEAAGVLVSRPADQLEQEIAHFTVLIRDDCVIGCAALYHYNDQDNDQAELACFVVDARYRGRGMAKNLLTAMIDKATASGAQQLFVLTTQTSDWFQEQGFVAADIQALPAEKQAQYDASRQSKVYQRAL